MVAMAKTRSKGPRSAMEKGDRPKACFKADDPSPPRRPLPKQDINIFAPGNLGIRMDEMVAPLALAHDRACLVESLS